MNTEEIESFLRRARPPELPAGWKRQILGSIARPVGRPVFPRLAWPALAACWSLILILRLTTPDVPQGGAPFDSAAFLARNARVERLLATGEFDPPPMDPLRIESIFRLPAPKNSPTT
ncbi:MAG: hypothetical protein WCQ16_04445 [Verrucomicrobiae bacterium]